jgi:Zn-dependent protease/predicted transcriptional regulator
MSGFRVAKVLGFEVRVDYSWFIIFGLILWSFTSGVFPARAPGLEPWAYALMGGIGALLFFVSLLLHELSHSVVAEARGIPVAGITLFLFGGMAHTTKEAESPGDEFLIAVVGPLSSFLIAVALGGLVWLGIRAGWHPAALIVGEYLAALNLALAVFNLLPGFPLDGGRLLRAVVWKVTGDVTRATRVASGAGRLLGYGLIALGVWMAIGGDLFGGVWLAFIGWFLRNAAVASLNQRLTQDVLQNVFARDAMTHPPRPVPAERTLEDLVEEFVVRQESGVLPVERHGTIVGLVSLKLVRAVPRERWSATTAADIMIPADADNVVTPWEPLTVVVDRLRASPVGRVLVMDGGRVAGIISAHDVTAWFNRARQQPG